MCMGRHTILHEYRVLDSMVLLQFYFHKYSQHVGTVMENILNSAGIFIQKIRPNYEYSYKTTPDKHLFQFARTQDLL